MNTSQVKPLKSNQVHWIGWHSIHLDEENLFTFFLNIFLEIINSQKRAYLILHEDALRASGVWTIEQAEVVADRLTIGTNGNFYDPKQKTGPLRLFQYLGWTN